MHKINAGSWIENYGDYLYSTAFIQVRNKELAEDLVQETLLSAYKAMDGFKGTSTEKTWLTAILKNKIIDYYRKKDVLKDVSIYLSDTRDSFFHAFFESAERRAGHWTADSSPRNWEVREENILDEKEFTDTLRSCVEKLPSKLIYLVTAKYFDEENAGKICKDLQISQSNYWVMLHRAKTLLRSCLEINWFGK